MLQIDHNVNHIWYW